MRFLKEFLSQTIGFFVAEGLGWAMGEQKMLKDVVTDKTKESGQFVAQTGVALWVKKHLSYD